MAGVHWLERRAHLDRGLRWLEILIFVMVAAMLVGGIALYGWLQLQVGVDANPAVTAQNRLTGLLAMIGLVQEFYPRV